MRSIKQINRIHTKHSSFPWFNFKISSNLSFSCKLESWHRRTPSSLSVSTFNVDRAVSSLGSNCFDGRMAATTRSTAFNLMNSSRTAASSVHRLAIRNDDLMRSFSLSVWMQPRMHSRPPMSMKAASDGSWCRTIQEMACMAWVATGGSSESSSIIWGSVLDCRSCCWQNGLFCESSATRRSVPLRTSVFDELSPGWMMTNPPTLKKSGNINDR